MVEARDIVGARTRTCYSPLEAQPRYTDGRITSKATQELIDPLPRSLSRIEIALLAGDVGSSREVVWIILSERTLSERLELQGYRQLDNFTTATDRKIFSVIKL